LEINIRSFASHFINRVYEQLKIILTESGAWPDFSETMCRALLFNQEKGSSKSESIRWALLPGLCCQAAGGDSRWADDLAIAWFLFYLAADLMDSVQDHDDPDPWWADLGSAPALSIASGLFFGASISLNKLHFNEATKKKAPFVIEDFYNGFLVMSGGQFLDLVYSEPTLEQFWNNAAAKSGSFFSLACRCGARLASEDPVKLEGYHKFGHHLGVLVQILDDLGEWKFLHGRNYQMNLHSLSRSLPVIYAMEVYPSSERERLQECLRLSNENPGSMDEALKMMDESGAALYLETEIERHREDALTGLERASPLSPAGEMLNALLDTLYHN
jgi:geranylgeranyl diphosphate synthase type I